MIREQRIPGPNGWLNVATLGDNGFPLVLLHGVTRGWADFTPIMASLAKNWRVIALDFRGHGGSAPAGKQYFVTDYLADVVALFEQLAIPPAVLYGHSLGAMVAAQFAARFPVAVKALILEEPPFETMGSRIGETALKGYFEQMQHLARKGLAVETLAGELAEIRLTAPGSALSTRLGDVRDAATLALAAQCLALADPEILTPIVAGTWLLGYDRKEWRTQIRSPVLLLQGNPAMGGMFAEVDASELEQICQPCKRVKFSEVGHHLHWTQPAEVLNSINAFFGSVAGADTTTAD